jgi:hypothetical protein
MVHNSVARSAIGFAAIAAIFLATDAKAQDSFLPYEEKSFSSPEGWAMAHSLSSALNLGSAPAEKMTLWKWGLEAELSSIPHLSREEQRVGFGGFKSEDMNKSPVFGRVRLNLGLPAGFTAQLSWTPPLEIDGARPDGLYGLALERSLVSNGRWQLGGRIHAVRGHARSDVTCSRRIARIEPGTLGNPFGCTAPSRDRIRMDQQGAELMLSRNMGSGRWQSFVAYASTRMDPFTVVEAKLFDSDHNAALGSKGTVDTYSVGASFAASPRWRLSAAFSYTPLDVRRPPLRERANGDFSSFRVALAWL